MLDMLLCQTRSGAGVEIVDEDPSNLLKRTKELDREIRLKPGVGHRLPKFKLYCIGT